MQSDDLAKMAARVFGEDQSEPPNEHTLDSATLLVRVEAFLNARASFERSLKRGPIAPVETDDDWHHRSKSAAYDLILQVSNLLPDIVGVEALRIFYGPVIEESASQKRQSFAKRLRVFRQILSAPNWAMTLAELTREIEDFDGGDIPNVLLPEKRNPGQSRRPTYIARLRLRALCWNEHLKARGIPANRRQGAVSDAYKATWDSIRKWREPCAVLFGERAIWEELYFASKEYWADYHEDAWETALKSDGAHYYETWSAQRGGTAS